MILIIEYSGQCSMLPAVIEARSIQSKQLLWDYTKFESDEHSHAN